MKNIVFIIIAISTMSSCKKFIELKPLSENSVGNFYLTGSDVEQGVIATYDGVQTLVRPGYLDHFAEVRSDNSFNFATTPGGGANADFDNFNLNAANGRLDAFWHASYLAIQRANVVLSRIDAVSIDEAVKKRAKGEVKFLRALTYFWLVQLWGDVPLVLEETKNPVAFIGKPRDPLEKVYAQIVTDLTEAAPMLPLTYNAANDGRVSQGAANALLARVYLVRKDYPKVVEFANKVVDSKVYSLDADFMRIFNYSGASPEVIFKINFKSGTNGEGFPFQNVIHDYDNSPSREFEATYKTTEPIRFAATPTIIKTYYSNKIHNTAVSTDNTINVRIIVLRYADVLLMKAEALNKISFPNPEALTFLNQVRTRASGNAAIPASAVSTDAAWTDVLLNERRIEFAFENLRWFDLVRTGKAMQVMTEKSVGGENPKAASALPYTFKERDLLYPVPQNQIDASGKSLSQNPGY